MGNHLRIPQPCHEDWTSMTIAERGRHCKLCDKVVRDFTGMEKAQVLEQVLTASNGVCGRVSPSVLTPPLPALAAYQLPAARLRLFILAFVVAFGLEAWGMPALQAQALQPNVKALKDPQKLQSALEQVDSNEVVLRGRVLDVYTREAVEFANVMAFAEGKLITGTLSDTAGNFELRFPKTALAGETYQLRLRYQGRERDDHDIKTDIRNFVYLIDASFMIEGIAVEEMRSRSGWEGMLIGQLITMTPVRNLEWRSLQPTGDAKSLYRPLDEWLMMHNSEIHHSGRW